MIPHVDADSPEDILDDVLREARARVSGSDADILLAAMAIFEGQAETMCPVHGALPPDDYAATMAWLYAVAVTLERETN